MFTQEFSHIHIGHCLFFMITILSYSATSLAQGTVHLGKSARSKEETINILKPAPSVRINKRGLQPSAQEHHLSQPEPLQQTSRSLSMVVNFEFDSARLTLTAIHQLT